MTGLQIDVSDFGLQMGDQAEVYYIDENGNRIGVELYTMLADRQLHPQIGQA